MPTCACTNPLRPAMESARHALKSAKHKSRHHLDAIKLAAKEFNVDTEYVDLVIRFIRASDLARVHGIGTANPCFRAKLDDKVSYTSSVKPNTLSPVWDETWVVKKVPSTATLSVVVRETETGAHVDNDIGVFQTTVSPGAKEVEIIGKHLGQNKGSFWLNIQSYPSAHISRSLPYTFDGPIHYSRHDSPTMGVLTHLRDTRLYSTWKIYIKGIPRFFGDTVQRWNHDYKAARAIFKGPTSIAVRSGIVAGHHVLYARTVLNGFGVITSADDVFKLLHGGPRQLSGDGSRAFENRIKPAVYTYVIAKEDETFRFSETGAAFFVDFASKHALHSNCAKSVVYSGEFHPRPEGGWENLSDCTDDSGVRWELVIDNNSGTYSPNPDLLAKVAQLLELNFAGINVVALAQDDPELKKSRDACREYALTKRGVKPTELEPHVTVGEETLSNRVSALHKI
ncbi:hypothetical protein DEU56DRAFT_782266 [Suillus clintonianus]|uniref:uncharacterized protein n=1 Tax=Suillus clintonianus TaxID=1904413 RepID=UPI001B87A513|nr:uncharacterized protein DEU56DRAFT_782266 [Suillus clintonianus]KAG2148789.1 hypothetical protein DEU56DRAFT_782266 [Suillus clintonianus]